MPTKRMTTQPAAKLAATPKPAQVQTAAPDPRVAARHAAREAACEDIHTTTRAVYRDIEAQLKTALDGFIESNPSGADRALLLAVLNRYPHEFEMHAQDLSLPAAWAAATRGKMISVPNLEGIDVAALVSLLAEMEETEQRYVLGAARAIARDAGPTTPAEHFVTDIVSFYATEPGYFTPSNPVLVEVIDNFSINHDRMEKDAADFVMAHPDLRERLRAELASESGKEAAPAA